MHSSDFMPLDRVKPRGSPLSGSSLLRPENAQQQPQ